MTETQNHRRPLAPGEVRTHTVGARTFRVMHVAGGSFTQATVRDGAGPSGVICTDRFEDTAVRAYAEAIEQAESDAVDALDDADGPDRFELDAPAADALAARAGFGPQVDFNLPMGADPALVYGERSGAAPTLADDVAALRTLIELYTPMPSRHRTDMLTRLDRIAGAVPQRATDVDGWGIWQHECGAAQSAKRGDGVCVACGVKSPDADGQWRALYTLGGE